MKKTALTLALAAALSTTAVQADDFVIATASEGGSYEALGNNFAGQIKRQKGQDFDIEVVNTNGTIENIEGLNDGTYQAAIVQMDGLNVYKPTVPVRAKLAHTEYVVWMYNKKNAYEDLEDIEGKENVAMVLVEGSGADVTMQSFVQADSGYKVNYENAIMAEDLYEAADIVADGVYDGVKVAGLLYTGQTVPQEIASDFRSQISIGEATDGDFDDAEDFSGEPLYTKCDIDKRMIRGMETSTMGKPDTVCLRAAIVYRTDFEDKKANKAVKKAAAKTVRGLK